MGPSEKSFNQVRSILGKLDRSIDEARQKRTQVAPPPPPAPKPLQIPPQNPMPINPPPARPANLNPARPSPGRATPIPSTGNQQHLQQHQHQHRRPA